MSLLERMKQLARTALLRVSPAHAENERLRREIVFLRVDRDLLSEACHFHRELIDRYRAQLRAAGVSFVDDSGRVVSPPATTEKPS